MAWKLVEKDCVAIDEDRARRDIIYSFKKGIEIGYNKANEWHDLRSKLMDFNETKVSADDYADYKRFMLRILNILKRYKCCKTLYEEFKTLCYEMELRLDRNLGE